MMGRSPSNGSDLGLLRYPSTDRLPQFQASQFSENQFKSVHRQFNQESTPRPGEKSLASEVQQQLRSFKTTDE